MPAKKKVESQTQVQSEEVQEVDEKNPSEFKSHINDGPTQDDLNPAYAAEKVEGDDDGDDKDSGDSGDGDK